MEVKRVQIVTQALSISRGFEGVWLHGRWFGLPLFSIIEQRGLLMVEYGEASVLVLKLDHELLAEDLQSETRDRHKAFLDPTAVRVMFSPRHLLIGYDYWGKR